MLKKIGGLLALSLTSIGLNAQTEVIMGPGTDGTTINTCLGGLFDSGGTGAAAPYGNDEDYVVTICPDVVGDDITLLWTVFDLDCTDELPGPPSNADRITIYDGDNTGAPTLGTYTCGALSPTDVFGASMFNPTGCLTIRFQSNGVGTGNFAAQVSCETPCEPPTAMAEIVDADSPEGDSIAVCIGETVTFGDNGSFPGPSGMFTIEKWVYHWQDGTPNDTLLTPGDVSHAFAEPGLYVVQLEVIDDNECSNTNTTDLNVFVTTYPTFDPFPAGFGVCAGEEVVLTADPSAYAVEWDGFPVGTYIEDNCMEDLTGIAQYTPMTITGYDPDISLSDAIPDVLSICVDIEHSFLGDFILQIQCPTGQIMTLHEQLGGGTYLGVPEDYVIDCDDPSTFGVPWHYCFTADAAETWADAAGGVATIPAGDYLPIDDFSALDGCPVNGTWNMIFTDMWGADDGSMPGWDITFADYLTPDVVTFTPEIGMGSDSSYWDTDPTITDVSADGNAITVVHPSPGDYTYTFNVINEFGCAFDSTVTLNVVSPAGPDAGLDAVTCHDLASPFPLSGSVTNPLAEVEWTEDAPPGVFVLFAPDEDILDPTVIVSEPGTYEFVLEATEPTGICGTETDTIAITFSAETHETTQIDPTCALDDGEITVNSTGLLGAVEYSIDGGATWVPTNVFTGLGPGTHTVTSRDASGCEFSSDVELAEPTIIEIAVSADTLICENGIATVIATASGGGADYNYFWSYGGTTIEETTGSIAIASADVPTIVEVYANTATGCVSVVDTIEITVRPPLSGTVSATDQVCPGDASGAEVLSIVGGDEAYTYSWTANGSVIAGETTTTIATNPLVETAYCATIEDGCESTPLTLCTTTLMSEVLNPTFTSDVTWGCEPTSITFSNTTSPASSIAEQRWTIEGVNYTTTNPLHKFETAGTYDVSLRLVSTDGCESSITANEYITIYPDPDPSYYVSPNPTNIFNTRVQFFNTTGGNNTYEWYTPGGNPEYSVGTENIVVNYPEGVANNYTTWLVATSEYGCQEKYEVIVDVVSDVLIYAPNIFTPDGDSYNETWRVYIDGIDIYDFHLTVFNRWGEIVWESYNADASWNGTYGSGGIVPDGTYVWIIEAKDGTTDKKYKFDGSFHIVR